MKLLVKTVMFGQIWGNFFQKTVVEIGKLHCSTHGDLSSNMKTNIGCFGGSEKAVKLG